MTTPTLQCFASHRMPVPHQFDDASDDDDDDDDDEVDLAKPSAMVVNHERPLLHPNPPLTIFTPDLSPATTANSGPIRTPPLAEDAPPEEVEAEGAEEQKPYDYEAQRERNYQLMLQGLQERTQEYPQQQQSEEGGYESSDSDSTHEKPRRMDAAEEATAMQHKIQLLEQDSSWCPWAKSRTGEPCQGNSQSMEGSTQSMDGYDDEKEQAQSADEPIKEPPIPDRTSAVEVRNNMEAHRDMDEPRQRKQKPARESLSPAAIAMDASQPRKGKLEFCTSTSRDKSAGRKRPRDNRQENSEENSSRSKRNHAKHSQKKDKGTNESSQGNQTCNSEGRTMDETETNHMGAGCTSSSPADAWDTRFRQLQAHKERTGEANPKKSKENSSSSTSRLGNWLANQRRTFRARRLEPERIQKLCQLGCTGFEITGLMAPEGAITSKKEDQTTAATVDYEQAEQGAPESQGGDSSGPFQKRSGRHRTAKKLFGIEQYDFS